MATAEICLPRGRRHSCSSGCRGRMVGSRPVRFALPPQADHIYICTPHRHGGHHHAPGSRGHPGLIHAWLAPGQRAHHIHAPHRALRRASGREHVECVPQIAARASGAGALYPTLHPHHGAPGRQHGTEADAGLGRRGRLAGRPCICRALRLHHRDTTGPVRAQHVRVILGRDAWTVHAAHAARARSLLAGRRTAAEGQGHRHEHHRGGHAGAWQACT